MKLTIIGCTLAVFVLVACGGDEGDQQPDASASSGGQSPVEVSVVDFGYDMPTEVPGPMIHLNITNDGEFAHELGLEQVKPGTTEEEIMSTPHNEEDPSWYVSNPAGISLLTSGQSMSYQRELEPGTYAFVCHFPTQDGEDHLHEGMVHVFEVTDEGVDTEPDADATVTVTDKAIELPKLGPGEQTLEFVNGGTQVHELGISGLPPETDTKDLASIGQEIGEWFGKGQPGPPPGGLVGPGGHQTIEPGESVWLTVTLENGFFYRFDDSSGKKPLEAFTTIK